MMISPLVVHAQRRLPALTSLFSDAVPASSITVVAGGTTTIVCSSPHGFTLASERAISITDAETPNPITAASIDGDGNVVMTTQFPHDLTTTPDPYLANAWNTSVKLTGFGSPVLDGVRQLVSAPNRNTFVIIPQTELMSVTVDGGEALLERLERQIVGYHKATVATTTTLTFPTHAGITRDFTITAPVVVTNVRCAGVLDIDAVMAHFTRPDMAPTPANKAWLFICPIEVRVGRSRNSRTDAIGDISEGADHRQQLLDGFELFVVIPTEHSPAGLKAIDTAQGDALRAILKTFYGLKMPRPEFDAGGSYCAILEAHGAAAYDKANYVHRYRFQATAWLSNADAIAPYDWPDLATSDFVDGVYVGGGGDGVAIYPIGTVPLRDIDLEPGIQHDAKPGKLTGNIKLDDAA